MVKILKKRKSGIVHRNAGAFPIEIQLRYINKIIDTLTGPNCGSTDFYSSGCGLIPNIGDKRVRG